ncbi:MAG: hypothetical protein ACI9W2_001525 [Gammaproteobacteria bacterium]|jgi:hypothetical protein
MSRHQANSRMGRCTWSPGALDQDLEGSMDRRDPLGYGKPFIDLVDRPHVFDPIVDIMGPYILHSMSRRSCGPPRIISQAIPTQTVGRPCDGFG